ncbi:hypothetical protein GCM10010321_32850 [Streptomyces chartreusis]|nr:hypothetical protein GCM10010321_32850 [Streptomyces chartreusis]
MAPKQWRLTEQCQEGEARVPDSETQRRTRLRLARQRPGPTQVRARERADETEEEPRGRRLNLLTLGAVVSIVATLGSLMTTGIGTLWSARVAADQLTQSRQQDEERKRAATERTRAQASRISIWSDRTRDGKVRVHLMNRSPDPVTRIFVAFAMLQVWGNPDLTSFAVKLDSLPPCSDSIIEQKTLRWATESRPHTQHPWESPGFLEGEDWSSLDYGVPHVAGIAFSDRDGIGWVRQEGGLSSGREALLQLGRELHGVEGRLTSEPLVQPAKACGDAGS